MLIGQPNELLEGGGFPDFNPMMFMHAEDNVEFFKPILPDSKIRSETHIYDVADKGKFALVTVKIKVFDEQNDLVAVILRSMLIKGIGGFGFKGAKPLPVTVIPKSEPSHVSEEKTSPN